MPTLEKHQKICFIALKAYPLFNSKIKSTFGGAEVQLSLLAREFAKHKDKDIHFMVADYGQDQVEKYNNVTIWKIFNFHDNVLKQMVIFFKVSRQISADVYIQRGLAARSSLIALYCRLKRKKFIYMVAHDSEADKTHEAYQNFLRRILVYLNFRLANKIIVQNLYQKNNLSFQSIILNSSFDIRNNLLMKREHILWVGRSEDWKRPEIFLELAKKFFKEKFIMICPPATHNSKLSFKIKENAKHIPNLIFVEFVPFNKIDNYFRKAKILVNTSIQEGFPNTFLQSAKNKTPILSLSVNPNGFLDKHECGFCCNGDLFLLTKRLKELLQNKKLYGKMSKNVNKYARENHDIKINVQKFLAIIEKLETGH
jgi:glycosyltransferase involved in cell wall biosynthesis